MSDARAVAAAGGLLAGSIVLAASQVTTATAATLTGTILTGLRSPVSVTSRMDGSSTAATKGVTVSLPGALQLGGSIATAGFGGSNSRSDERGQYPRRNLGGCGSHRRGLGRGHLGRIGRECHGLGTADLWRGGAGDGQPCGDGRPGRQVTSLREVRVRSDLTSSARSTASDKGLGFASFGLTRSYATNSAAPTAQMRAGAVASGSLIRPGGRSLLRPG